MANIGMGAGLSPAGAEAPSGAPGIAAPPAEDMLGALGQQHAATAATFDKLQAAAGVLGKARQAMDKLATLGPNVTGEDAIAMGGELVQAGVSAGAVAQLLAGMPPGGDALAAWVGQMDEDLKGREAQLRAAQKATQHHMGVNAFRMLAAGAMPPEPAPPEMSQAEGPPNAA